MPSVSTRLTFKDLSCRSRKQLPAAVPILDDQSNFETFAACYLVDKASVTVPSFVSVALSFSRVGPFMVTHGLVQQDDGLEHGRLASRIRLI